MEEEFVDIKGYEGLYQINRLGVVKSLNRIDNRGHLRDEKILKQNITGFGYNSIGLRKNNIRKRYLIHILLIKTFVGYYDKKYYAVDHIDRNTLNNNLDNLRIVSHRNNYNNKNNQSKYGVGVRFNKNNKFNSEIQINKKYVYLGNFQTKEQAHSKYLEVKNQIEEIEKITRSYSFTKTKINGEYFLDFFPIQSIIS